MATNPISDDATQPADTLASNGHVISHELKAPSKTFWAALKEATHRVIIAWPKGALDIAKTLWDATLKSPWVGLFLLTIVLSAVVLLRFVGFDAFTAIPAVARIPDSLSLPSIAKSALWLSDIDPIRTCVSQARSSGRPYVILSIAQHVRLEDKTSANGKSTIRHASERIFYVLLTLRDISKDEDVFKEQYQGSERGATPAKWYGPRIEEDVLGVPGAYQVRIDARAGTLLTVVTGAERDFPLPLKTISSSNYNVGIGEDFWDYPNAENDVVCELTLTVESPTLRLIPVRGWQQHKAPQSSTMLAAHDMVSSVRYTGNSTSGSVFMATWHLLKDDDVAVVIFTYGQPQ